MWETGVAGLPRGLWAAAREERLRRAVHARVSPGTVNRPVRSWTREGEGPEDEVGPAGYSADSLCAVV